MGDPRGSMGRPSPVPGNERCSVSQEMALVMGTMWRGPLQSCFCLLSWEDEQLPPPFSLSPQQGSSRQEQLKVGTRGVSMTAKILPHPTASMPLALFPKSSLILFSVRGQSTDAGSLGGGGRLYSRPKTVWRGRRSLALQLDLFRTVPGWKPRLLWEFPCLSAFGFLAGAPGAAVVPALLSDTPALASSEPG